MSSRPMSALKLEHRDDGTLEVVSTLVGYWVSPPARGTLVTPGMSVGAIVTLGHSVPVVAPEGAAGMVTEVFDPARTHSAVDAATVLFVLDPEAAGSVATVAAQGETSMGLVMPAPMSGRYYARPSPDQPPFVEVGDVIETGHAVGLLEVMKTFNRITYGGDGLPARARVVRILPADGDDLDGGQPLLEIEAV